MRFFCINTLTFMKLFVHERVREHTLYANNIPEESSGTWILYHYDENVMLIIQWNIYTGFNVETERTYFLSWLSPAVRLLISLLLPQQLPLIKSSGPVHIKHTFPSSRYVLKVSEYKCDSLSGNRFVLNSMNFDVCWVIISYINNFAVCCYILVPKLPKFLGSSI